MNIDTSGEYGHIGQLIKQHLKMALPEDVYRRWIDDFVFESIDSKKIIVGYYGNESLKEFNRDYKDIVWVNICSVAGYSKELKVYKRNSAPEKQKKVKFGRQMRTAKLFLLCAVFVIIALGVSLIAENYISNRTFRETFYSVSSIKANNRVRVIQISDLHNSVYGSGNTKLINRIEKLKPDLIVLTGDCIDSSDRSENQTLALCEKLAKIAPSYYIYGNNETEKFYDFGFSQKALDDEFGFNDLTRDPSKLTDKKDDFQTQLEKTGVKVLKNETDIITVGSTEVEIYGVFTSNPSAFWSYAGRSFDDYIYKNTGNLKITAIHEPFVFETYTDVYSWGDLILAGHTHGGVARIPMFGSLFTKEGGFFPERKGCYVYGRYEVSGSPLIVSSGLANNNIYRVNNKPELVIVDINKY